MTFLSPITALIAAAITVPLLVLMYFLKLRRRQVVISSTLLWKRAVQDLQVNSPFQKLRKNLLLLLQLLILAGLLLALARPMFQTPARTGDRLIILIDQSASMNAADVAPSRLEAAKQKAGQLIDQFKGGGGAMIVTFAHQARVIQPFTSDAGRLQASIAAIGPTDLESRLAPALQLIEPYTASTAGRKEALAIYVLSDGRIADEQNLEVHGGELFFIPIGKDPVADPPDNLAIVALSARRDYQTPQNVQVFARLVNFGPAPRKANLAVAIDGQVRKVIEVNVPATPRPVARTDGKIEFPEPSFLSVPFEIVAPGQALVQVSHDAHDALSADDSAAIVLPPPRKLRVLLVTNGNAFLEKMIDAAGVRSLTVLPPKRFEDQDPRFLGRGAAQSDEGFDLIVFDDYSPASIPPVNSLYLGGVPPAKNLARVPTAPEQPQTQVVLNWDRRHPLLRYVALDDLILVKPGRLALPDNAVVLASGPTGPLAAEWIDENIHHIVFSFNVLQTNWPMQVSFAVFMTNVLNHLGLGGETGVIAFRPGQVPVVPVEGSPAQVAYTGPVNLAGRVEQGRATLPLLEHVGLYRASAGVPSPWDTLAVNLADERESDLRVQTRTLPVAAASGMTLPQNTSLRQEVWWWFALGALVVLMLEWLVYTRRMHL